MDQWITSFSSLQNNKLTGYKPRLPNTIKNMRYKRQLFRPYLCRNPVSSPVADFSRRMLDITLGYSHQGGEKRVAEANQVTRQHSAKPFLLLSWDFLR